MTTELDTLATALYVRTDDLLEESPHPAPERPAVGIEPQLSDAELITLAVLQALPGYDSGAGGSGSRAPACGLTRNATAGTPRRALPSASRSASWR